MNKILSIWMAIVMAVCITSCDDEQTFPKMPAGKFYVSLGVTINGVTTYYVVNTGDLMQGLITARGQGLEQTGYRDFVQNDNVIYSVGGLGTVDCNGILIDKDGNMEEKGNFIFANKLDGMASVDAQTMMAMEMPKDQQKGGHLTFYTIDNNTINITKTVDTTPVAPLDDRVEESLNWWPTITGMEYSGGNVYVAYYPMHPLTCLTPDEDTARVAVYSYPGFEFKKLMKDDRAGATGSFNAFNALTKDENGDLYVLTNTSIYNGFAVNGSKPAGFLKIRSGETDFDPVYQFDFQQATGGYRPVHILYIGKGKAVVECSNPTDGNIATDRWTDKDLKVVVVDLYNKEVHDVEGVPVHNGLGSRHFPAVADGKYVYMAVSGNGGSYIYRIDTESYTAERGAQVEATFVCGLFAAK